MSAKTSRLFVGLSLPPVLAQQLALLGGGIEGARWEAPEKLHLTLRYLGDVDGGQRAELDACLRGVRAAPFSLSVRGCGHFPPRGEPRSLWLGLQDCPALTALQRAVLEMPADDDAWHNESRHPASAYTVSDRTQVEKLKQALDPPPKTEEVLLNNHREVQSPQDLHKNPEHQNPHAENQNRHSFFSQLLSMHIISWE